MGTHSVFLAPPKRHHSSCQDVGDRPVHPNINVRAVSELRAGSQYHGPCRVPPLAFWRHLHGDSTVRRTFSTGELHGDCSGSAAGICPTTERPSSCLLDSGSGQTQRTQPAFSAQETGMSDQVSTSITAALSLQHSLPLWERTQETENQAVTKRLRPSSSTLKSGHLTRIEKIRNNRLFPFYLLRSHFAVLFYFILVSAA